MKKVLVIVLSPSNVSESNSRAKVNSKAYTDNFDRIFPAKGSNASN
jgi:hypothetical protein